MPAPLLGRNRLGQDLVCAPLGKVVSLSGIVRERVKIDQTCLLQKKDWRGAADYWIVRGRRGCEVRLVVVQAQSGSIVDAHPVYRHLS